MPLDGQEDWPTAVPPLFPLPRLEELPSSQAERLGEIGAFFGGRPPNVFLALAVRPAQLRATWDYARAALSERRLSRKVKTMIGFTAGVCSRSAYGINLFRRELERLGGDRELILEVLSIVQLYESATKVADLLLMPAEVENAELARTKRRRDERPAHGLD